MPLLQHVGGDVEGDRKLGARPLLLTVETEVVVVVLELWEDWIGIELPLPGFTSSNWFDLLLNCLLIKGVSTIS